MMTLETTVVEASKGIVQVAWRTGLSNFGVVEVSLDKLPDDTEVAAELLAIRYLMFKRQVFDRVPSSSKGYLLRVGKGAIKKLAQGRSSKEHLKPYAEFLRQRLEGVQIEVSRAGEWVNLALESEVETIDFSGDLVDPHERLMTPAMGEIHITKHAVRRYAERHGDDITNPWGSLTTRLMHPGLRQVEIPRKALLNKAMRHGRADNVEAWGHPDSRFTYIVVNDKKRRTLVTVFRKPKPQRAYMGGE